MSNIHTHVATVTRDGTVRVEITRIASNGVILNGNAYEYPQGGIYATRTDRWTMTTDEWLPAEPETVSIFALGVNP